MCPRRPWDHPRVCGEQLRRLMPPSAYQEPSPRVRGAGRGPLDQARFAGIIPRVCGEQRSLQIRCAGATGSSPRVRGAAQRAVRQKCLRGIIPARAGSRPLPSVRPASRWDHPRACGEQPSYGEHMAHLSGSSPRVRGADLDTVVSLLVDGIIPARAGSSPTTPSAPSTRWDHPRACGEQNRPLCRCRSVPGSSPRVRGAGALLLCCGIHRGIIPARAGSSLDTLSRRHTKRDHPRACGEQVLALGRSVFIRGSSPRVRGAVRV